MLSLKRFFSALFSLRLIVVCMAVGLLVVKTQFAVFDELNQYIFQIPSLLSAPVDNVVFWPMTFQTPEMFALNLLDQGLQTPAFFSWFEVLLISCSASFLVIILPKLNSSTGVLLVLVLLVTLVLSQLYMQVLKQQWYPFGATMLYLAIGYFVMLFWLPSYQKIQNLSVDLQTTKVRLSRLLFQQGQLQEAHEVLTSCAMDREVIDATYDIALQHERKRQYDQAIDAYRRIISIKKGYKDAEHRLNELKQFEQVTSQATEPQDMMGTLLLPQQSVSKPILGRYEVDRELGRGAMGVVYLGRDPKISRTVAIKTLNYGQFDSHLLAELKERFFREAEAAGRLSHPGIVTVYDVGEEPDLAFIAMDYAEGKPLNSYNKPKSLLPIDRVHSIILNVADALEYAHEQKIVHRDIKPENIIYNASTGEVKVTDFGIARITDGSKTRTGSVMGSPLYMSPEQLMGKKVAGSSDIYSLGVTFYQLLTGHTPFDGDSLANLTYQIINQKPKNIKTTRDDIASGTVRIINKSLQKDPEKRFSSAGAMALAIRKVIEKEYVREVVS